jgi:cytosine/adenosine deaminase-related metal-dependent hydrolase
MGYWKIQADWLFDGEKMVGGPAAGGDAAASGSAASDAPVLVGRDNGQIEALIPAAEAGDDVRRYSGLLCPGFINTHCHLELSHMAGVIPPGTGMVDFLLQVMSRRGELGGDPLDAAREADRRMGEEGIVAVGDISNNISTLPIKAGSQLYYHTFIEVMGFMPASAEARLAQARQVYDAARRVLGVDAASLVPHAPYSVSKPLFEALNKTAEGTRGILSIHNQESEAENQFYKDAGGDFLKLYSALGQNIDFFHPYGQSSLQTYLPWLDAPSGLLLVHNTASAPEDIRFALGLAARRNQSLFWCLCPGANQYIQQALPPLSLLRDHGCMLTLGTDSLASNYDLSILSEIKILRQHFPEVPLEEMLRWATLNGARALKVDDVFGRFAPGTRPGVLLLGPLQGQTLTPETAVKVIY